MTPDVLALLIPLVGMGVGALFLTGVYKLLSRWLDRRGQLPAPEVADELARLRGEVEGVQELTRRLEEVEERLDFAERLLTQQQHDRLPSGG